MLAFYSDERQFVAAVNYTAARFNFNTRLIEKDYLCSLVLNHLYQTDNCDLTFKGGTLLAKIHAGFYRLSEDLDFSISIARDATRKKRSNMAKPYKNMINNITDQLNIFELRKPLSGSNESRQYNSILTYESNITHAPDNILIDIGLREKHVKDAVNLDANTLLANQFTGHSLVQPFAVKCYSLEEAYAEKTRAALTREKSAIRDFFDIHYALKHNIISLTDQNLIKLIRDKLSASNDKLIDFDDERVNFLTNRIKTELDPTLQHDANSDFNLNQVIKLLEALKKDELEAVA